MIFGQVIMGRAEFIEKHSALFWYTPQNSKQNISDSLLVETMLNYGTWSDCKELLQVLTPRRVAQVFFAASERQKKNYYPEIYNLFAHILRKYA